MMHIAQVFDLFESELRDVLLNWLSSLHVCLRVLSNFFFPFLAWRVFCRLLEGVCEDVP